MSNLAYETSAIPERTEADFGSIDSLRPIPRISIQAFCETEGVARPIERAGEDRRMAKAHLKVHMGGIDTAVEFYKSAPTPNLILLESRCEPREMLATLFIIVIGKSVAAFVIVVAFRYPVGTALIISASLAQIGEFSFILAELGVGLNLLPEQGRDLILAGAILSIVINPLLFAGVDRLKPWLEKRAAAKQPAPASPEVIGPVLPEAPPEHPDPDETPPSTTLTGHTILVGYGRVGSLIGKALKEAQVPFLVIEDGDKSLERLSADGIEAINGNAARADVLAAANPLGARRLILAIPNAFEAGPVVARAKAANPAITVIARAHSDADVEHLTGLGADYVIMGEREIARGIVEHVLDKPEARDPA